MLKESSRGVVVKAVDLHAFDSCSLPIEYKVQSLMSDNWDNF